MLCGKAFLGKGHCLLTQCEARIHQLLDDDSPDAAIAELMDCLPFAECDEALAALDDVVGYSRSNLKRMKYRTFLNRGLPVGSGIVESAHRHLLRTRMKRAGQRSGLVRARRMARLRGVYRTACVFHFHHAIRNALAPPALAGTQTQGTFRSRS